MQLRKQQNINKEINQQQGKMLKLMALKVIWMVLLNVLFKMKKTST